MVVILWSWGSETNTSDRRRQAHADRLYLVFDGVRHQPCEQSDRAEIRSRKVIWRLSGEGVAYTALKLW